MNRLLGAFLLLLSLAPALPAAEPDRRPNILFAMADDWAWPHAGVYGDKVVQTPTFDRSLDLISPWLDMQTRDRDSVIADLDAQQHRRFIKSHTPFDGIPDDEEIGADGEACKREGVERRADGGIEGGSDGVQANLQVNESTAPLSGDNL